ncbi:DUF983 domain-containing protein [Aureibacter tunicatorum]|uniref:Uncharacterized protein (DUF983 family) n=1 Tax=Aureibacter tunicatorum TaxID=866807 RepID=A0AAE4BS01_9BACT|nr:DUF983 domain-containing protein [Aureibacter tunicatorum]MDR6238375.1 uncharacterized protein (DUF983 family) [Aureibacter tunicatorum]BDD03407.1 hypothetical protein AUTU_08900 [Aureibacter tunicatorum]
MKNRTQALLNGKCPKCHTGDIYKHKWHELLHFNKMNKTCPHCEQRFEVEPGFFIGAMYISYAFNVAIMVATGLMLHLFAKPAMWVYIVSVLGASLVLLPFSFRISRVLFLYLFGGIQFKENIEAKA